MPPLPFGRRQFPLWHSAFAVHARLRPSFGSVVVGGGGTVVVGGLLVLVVELMTVVGGRDEDVVVKVLDDVDVLLTVLDDVLVLDGATLVLVVLPPTVTSSEGTANVHAPLPLYTAA